MDSFETLVGFLLEKDGYWVRTSVKVGLTTREKKKIGRPSSPRWSGLHGLCEHRTHEIEQMLCIFSI